MPKSENPSDSKQVIDSHELIHNEEIRSLLQTDQTHCDFATSAAALAALGLRTHPLKPRGKSPLLRSWQKLATSNPDTLGQWAEQYPTANTGIVAGAASGIIIVDMDLRHGARASLRDLQQQHGPLPQSWEALTPGGWHLYLRHPGSKVPASVRIADGIDVRGDKANVVAPGSIHPSGGRYCWNPLSHPEQIPLAEAPPWLLERLESRDQPPRKKDSRDRLFQVEILAPFGALEGLRGVGGSLNGALVRELYSQKAVIEKLLPVLGLGEREIGEKFHCILHDERHPSAAIMPPMIPGEPHEYVDFHERERVKSFSLPYVYYRLKVGPDGEYVKRLNPPSHLVWSLRLLRDAGVIEGVKIDAPALPNATIPSIKTVYAAFLDVLSLKFLVDEGDPSPFTWRFGMAWTGLSKRAVTGAMSWLMSRGYIQFIRYFGGRGWARKMMLFLQGTKELIEERLGTLRLRERPDAKDKPRKAASGSNAVADDEAAGTAAESAKTEIKEASGFGEGWVAAAIEVELAEAAAAPETLEVIENEAETAAEIFLAPAVADDAEAAVNAEADASEAVRAEPEPEGEPSLPEAPAEAQADEAITDEAEPVEQPAEPPPEAAEPAAKWCRKCGEVREWFTFGAFVACGECFQPLDAGG